MIKRALDLSGPLAKLDWADGQIPAVEAAQAELLAKNTRQMFGLRMSTGEPNQTFVRTYIDHFTAPPALTAHIGAIIHAQRTALDFLISELSERNGAAPNRKPHFPVRKEEQEFMTDKRVRMDMRDLTDREKAIVVGLKPWKGGNDQIYLMHDLDLQDKHRKLIVASRHFSALSIEGNGWIKSIGFGKAGRSGKDTKVSMLRDGTVDFVPTIELATTTEDGTVVPILRTLHDFSAVTRDILKLFDVEATREANQAP